jgi:hypothetical protein
MAAVLCKTIGELCSAAGQVVCLPCKACNVGCESLGQVFLSPFFPYLAVTLGLNMPALVYGIRSLGVACPSLSSWLMANGLLCLIHMIAAFYIVHKIRESAPTNNNNSTPSNNVEEGTPYQNFTVPKENEHGAENSFARIKHVLCYDKTMAVYIIVFIGWMIWLCMGLGREGDCPQLRHYMNVSIGCGYLYTSLVGVAFACSLCCLR